MKELLIKFEKEEDYERMIKEVIIPSLKENKIEFDSQNNIIIVK